MQIIFLTLELFLPFFWNFLRFIQFFMESNPIFPGNGALYNPSFPFPSKFPLFSKKKLFTNNNCLSSTRRLAAQKSAVVHLQRLYPGQKTERVFMNWTWWVLAGLPFPHLVRVMDCFFHEGIKVFYRISLAILILYQKHVPNTTSNATFGIANEVMASSSASSTTTTTVTSKTNDVVKPNNLKLSKALDDKNNDIEMALPNFCRKLPVTPGKLLRTAFNIRALR